MDFNADSDTEESLQPHIDGSQTYSYQPAAAFPKVQREDRVRVNGQNIAKQS